MPISSAKLDDAARAGWLYYVAGNTQDQIAAKLGISRQSAQRLVSLAVTEKLVKVRIDHPIARCLELARSVQEVFALRLCEITPSDPGSASTTLGVAQAAAAEIERWLRRPAPVILAIGTGRTLKAAIELLPRIDCPQHKIVSLTGAIGPDGSAAYYNVVFTMMDLITAHAFPMLLPIFAASAEERSVLHGQVMIRSTLDLARRADVTFVGIGDLGEHAPLTIDGFLSRADLVALRNAGAVGEIIGWAFDRQGHPIEGLTNTRVASADLPACHSSLVIATAKGHVKLPSILAALRGRLVNGLITDEATAEGLLNEGRGADAILTATSQQ